MAQALCALIDTATGQRVPGRGDTLVDLDEAGQPPVLASEKGLAWRRFVDTGADVVAGPGEVREVTETITDAAVVRVWSIRLWTADELAALARRERAALDADYQVALSAWRTPGKDMIYLRKQAEAETIVAVVRTGATPAPDLFPLLSQEVGITGATLAGVGAVVHAKAQAWLTAGGAIEGLYLRAKAAIAAAVAAGDGAGLVAVRPAVAWPVPG